MPPILSRRHPSRQSPSSPAITSCPRPRCSPVPAGSAPSRPPRRTPSALHPLECPCIVHDRVRNHSRDVAGRVPTNTRACAEHGRTADNTLAEQRSCIATVQNAGRYQAYKNARKDNCQPDELPSSFRNATHVLPECYPSTTEELPDSDRSATEDPKMLPMCSLSVPSRHALPKCPDIQGTCVLPKCNLSATSMCYLGPTYLNVCYLSPTYVRPTNYLHATECYRMLPQCFRELPTATDVLPKRCLGATRASEVLPMCDQQTTKALQNAPSCALAKCYPCVTTMRPKCYLSSVQVLPKHCLSAPSC